MPSGQGKRRIGGQPGHPRHERPAFPPDQVDRIRTWALHRCPDCGGRLKRQGKTRVLQQMEIVRRPVRVVEHRAGSYRCTRCGKTHDASIPPHVRRSGLMGPNLMAIVAWLKGAGHASFSTVRKFLKYMEDFGVLVQFCLAHLIREVKFLLTLPDPVTRRYGERLLGVLRRLFGVIHRRAVNGYGC